MELKVILEEHFETIKSLNQFILGKKKYIFYLILLEPINHPDEILTKLYNKCISLHQIYFPTTSKSLGATILAKVCGPRKPLFFIYKQALFETSKPFWRNVEKWMNEGICADNFFIIWYFIKLGKINYFLVIKKLMLEVFNSGILSINAINLQSRVS